MAADIINKQDPTGKAMNPGLVALWEDERLRREAAGVRDSLSPPPSPRHAHLPPDRIASARRPPLQIRLFTLEFMHFSNSVI